MASATAAKRPVKPARDYFGMNLTEMKAEWMGKDETDVSKILTTEDKDQLLNGIEDGTLTYEVTAEQRAAASARVDARRLATV